MLGEFVIPLATLGILGAPAIARVETATPIVEQLADRTLHRYSSRNQISL